MMFKGYDVQEEYKKMAEEKYKKNTERVIEKFLKYYPEILSSLDIHKRRI